MLAFPCYMFTLEFAILAIGSLHATHASVLLLAKTDCPKCKEIEQTLSCKAGDELPLQRHPFEDHYNQAELVLNRDASPRLVSFLSQGLNYITGKLDFTSDGRSDLGMLLGPQAFREFHQVEDKDAKSVCATVSSGGSSISSAGGGQAGLSWESICNKVYETFRDEKTLNLANRTALNSRLVEVSNNLAASWRKQGNLGHFKGYGFKTGHSINVWADFSNAYNSNATGKYAKLPCWSFTEEFQVALENLPYPLTPEQRYGNAALPSDYSTFFDNFGSHVLDFMDSGASATGTSGTKLKFGTDLFFNMSANAGLQIENGTNGQMSIKTGSVVARLEGQLVSFGRHGMCSDPVPDEPRILTWEKALYECLFSMSDIPQCAALLERLQPTPKHKEQRSALDLLQALENARLELDRIYRNHSFPPEPEWPEPEWPEPTTTTPRTGTHPGGGGGGGNSNGNNDNNAAGGERGSSNGKNGDLAREVFLIAIACVFGSIIIASGVVLWRRRSQRELGRGPPETEMQPPSATSWGTTEWWPEGAECVPPRS